MHLLTVEGFSSTDEAQTFHYSSFSWKVSLMAISRRQKAFIVSIFLFLTVTAFSQDRQVAKELADSFRKVDVVGIDVARDHRSLSFRANGRAFNLTITPHDLRSNSYKAIDRNAEGDTILGAFRRIPIKERS